MNILFIHQNFPGQFLHLAPALAADKENTVVALTMRQIQPGNWNGVRIVPYRPTRSTSKEIHPWVSDFETKIIRAQACMQACLELKNSGFQPDLVIAHPGWGESLFVKDVWPATRLALYCEFFYRATGADSDFDPEFQSPDTADACRIRVKNAIYNMHADLVDFAISPTEWQKSTFPKAWQERITVIHDGINTEAVAPNENAFIRLKTQAGDDLTLSRNNEVITFINRNLEPYRGYHVFMRALPEILRQRPAARVLIVGDSDVSYGAAPPAGKTWKEIFVDEVRSKISDSDWARVHFVGKLPYPAYVNLLQISTVHVYLTYPFVLSWSLLEAMSAGCAIVASDTAPIREVIEHKKHGLLINFFDSTALADQVTRLAAATPEVREQLGAQARQEARARFDLAQVCLPGQLAFVKQALKRRKLRSVSKKEGK
jgi:glycosyltransferase involved in cell wall biosynthesis